jgi:hypothetical protein
MRGFAGNFSSPVSLLHRLAGPLLVMGFSWRDAFCFTGKAVLALASVALPSAPAASASSILSVLSLGKIFGGWLFLCQ